MLPEKRFPVTVKSLLKLAGNVCVNPVPPLAVAAAIGAHTSPGLAQSYDIDGGTSESVDGSGGGDHTSPWTLGGSLIIGDTSTGTLTIENGAEVGAEDIYIGDDAGSNGTVTVEDSSFHTSLASGLIYVGNSGEGSLSLIDSDSEALAFLIGQGSGSKGAVDVSGGAAALSTGANLVLGHSGTGTLTIENGATVSAGQDLLVGYSADGEGSVSISGSTSTLTVDRDIVAGHYGTATITIEDGASVTAGSELSLGGYSGSSASVVIDGGSLTVGAPVFIADAGSASITLSNGGTLDAGTSDVTLADDSAGTGTLNIGAAADKAATAAGTLIANSLIFGSGTGALTFNHTDTAYVFSLDVSGNGSIGFVSGNTSLTGDYSAFTGDLHVDGGTVSVNTTLTADISVSDEGILGGSGTLGDVAVSAGGMLAPGNSIGTLNVTSATFNTSSTLEVELNDGGFVAGTNNDLLNATGAVTINGGTVRMRPENGTDDGSAYTLGTYTIITAASVTGTFDSVTDDYVFIDFADSYDASNVYVTSHIAASFSDVSRTRNQRATSVPLEALGSGNAIFDALQSITGTEANARAAIDSLSGELHASVKTALLEDSRFAREAALDRLRVALDRRGCRNSPQPRNNCERKALWTRGYGSWSYWSEDGNAAGVDRSTGGLLTGGDLMILENLSLGVLAGYARSEIAINHRASSASVDSYTLGTYGGGTWNALSLKGGLAHSWHVLDSARSVAFNGFSDRLTANYNARTLQTFAEAGYSFGGDIHRFQPFAGIAYVHENSDSYSEDGNEAALAASAQSESATFTTLGVRGSTRIDIAGRPASLAGSLGWRHAFGSTPTAAHEFAGEDTFAVSGVPLSHDVLMLDAGVGMNLSPHARLGLSYSGQVGSGISDHGAKASVNVSF